MEHPTVDELRRLREGTTMEQLILIKSLSQLNTTTVVYPILEIVAQGKEELIQEVSDAFYNMRQIIIPTLKAEITNKNYFIRWVVALTMNKIADKNFKDHLILALGIGYEPVIKIIVETLHKIDPETFPIAEFKNILIRLNENEKNAVAQYAIQQLGVNALDTTETLFAIRTLQMLEWSKSLIPLLKARYHHDSRVRQEVKQLIDFSFKQKDIVDTCIDILDYRDEINNKYNFKIQGELNFDLNIYAIEWLGENGTKKAKKKLWSLINTPDLLEKVFVIKSLSKINSDMENSEESRRTSEILKKQINKLLHDCDSTQRLKFIRFLGEVGEKYAISAIISYMDDSNPSIKYAVINALSHSPKEQDILEKAAIFLTDKDVQVRRATVQLFWKLDPDRFFGINEGDIISKLPEPTKIKLLNVILEGLRSGSYDYKEFAAFWMGVLRFEPTYKVLIRGLRDPLNNERIISRIIVALGIFGKIEAIDHLIRFIYHEDTYLQKKSIESIGSLGLDGLFALIHQLYQKGETNIPMLENYIISYGGRILDYLLKEIEMTEDPIRKLHLKAFYQRVCEKYKIRTSRDFNIML